MYQRILAFWFCAFLLTVSSLREDESWKNFTNDDEQSDNSTMPCKLNANQDDNTNLAHNLRDNFGIDTSMSNKGKNFTLELRVKSDENDDKNDDEIDDENDDNIVSYKACDNNICQLIKKNCVFWKDVFFLLEWPNVTSNDVMLKIAFEVIANATCTEREYFWFDNNYMNDNENAMFFDNATSLYLSRHDIFISRISDCLFAEYRALENNNATLCDFTIYTTRNTMWMYLIILTAVLIISSLCLLITFIVYSICPELRNLHGYALRSYIFSFFIMYNYILLTEGVAIYNGKDLKIGYSSCLGLVFIFYFFSVATFLWQSVICFDIFWTFRKMRSIQRSVKQSQRKMYVMCSIYAWGIACGYIIVLAIMNFVPNMPENIIQPEICLDKFNIAENVVDLYYNIPMGLIAVGNIGFFIFTILKIVCAKRDIDHRLRADSENRRNDNNKQRYIMYLKLFILMDIITSLRWTIGAVWKYGSFYTWYPLHILYALQGIIVFVSFVCNKKILQHLRNL